MSHLQDRIERWWTAFQGKAQDIVALFEQEAEWDLPGWIREHLDPIHPELMWEFGPAVEGPGHRLVITPESRRHLRPLVAEILRRAPQLDLWEFYAYRLPEEYDVAVPTVAGRTGGNIANTFFRATVGEFNRIDLVFLAKHYGRDDRDALNDVFVATETLLGEEVLDKWIGAIDVKPLARDDAADLAHIRELQVVVDGLIQQVRDSLPDRPYCDLDPEQQGWTLYELEPEESDDYPGQIDMFVGKAMVPTIWENAHSSSPFDSVRYSKCGETFCYVKIDGTEDVNEKEFDDRSELEDALDGGLREHQLGCLIGGGTGLRYSYIDLALVDVDRGIEIVKKVLQDGSTPKRTWILFFDADLQSRWIGIWDGAPPPPLPDFQETD